MLPLLTPKEKLEYAKICGDRFVEIYKARLAIFTFIFFAVITLTGFGVQYKQPALFLLAAAAPIGLLVVDIMIKQRYAAPFLYIALKMESQVVGTDSSILLFVGADFSRTDLHSEFAVADSCADQQRRFEAMYVWRGFIPKSALLLLVSAIELLVWHVLRSGL
ncbi:hypothetical protein [Variovorax sp. dw_954]|uniref:hypothetical protein n=1 Tax=Variovorax sp. dw_954 TaxID=2720078 RepID=UPI001BD20A2B|nr:hypothetical protein [Variovorax sp. dw_954]